jgi:predicted transglutaminase-like cysteine proteinase
MRRTATISLLLAALATGTAFADCTPPNSQVYIPSGASATKDEMVAAQAAVKNLNAAVVAYSDCLKQEEDAKVADGADKAKTHAAYAKLNNDQVAKLQQIASKFNEELHAYLAKNSPAH